jgi:hypothetical protein
MADNARVQVPVRGGAVPAAAQHPRHRRRERAGANPTGLDCCGYSLLEKIGIEAER